MVPTTEDLGGPVCFFKCRLKDSWYDQGRIYREGKSQLSCMQATESLQAWATWNKITKCHPSPGNSVDDSDGCSAGFKNEFPITILADMYIFYH